MTDTIQGLYEVITQRKEQPQPGSYTCYLFEKGLDKILKKCAEECGEVIIAAKNCDNAQTVEELCDLTYHLLVLMAEQGITPAQVQAILEERRKKLGNLKEQHISDHNT